MIAVIFEVSVREDAQNAYPDAAAELSGVLQQADGLISIERFQSISTPGKLLSLSFWRDEAAVTAWRNQPQHRIAQQTGRENWFASYRLRVTSVLRDYGMHERAQAPADSKQHHQPPPLDV